MKILVNALSARLGGGQTYLINLFSHIPKADNLEILVFAPPSLVLPSHPCIRRIEPQWPVENPIGRAVWEKLVLPSMLRRENADVLFCPGGVVGTSAPAGCMVVTMFRNMIPFDMRVRKSIPLGLQRVRNWVLQRVMLRSMSAADLTIFISKYARKQIESLIGIRRPVTIPHGVSPEFKTYDKKLIRPSFLPDSDYLLYVSRFDVYKHHYEVVTAYSKLPKNLQEKYFLVLVGETNLPEADRVERLIERLELHDNVLVIGSVPYKELPAVYHHAYLNMFASSCENCPNILLEALGSGRPVLCSNVMPMPEFGGDAAIYFSPFDPDDIAEKMLYVLSDRCLVEQLAKRAERQCEKYDWEKTAAETWSRILELAEVPHSDGRSKT